MNRSRVEWRTWTGLPDYETLALVLPGRRFPAKKNTEYQKTDLRPRPLDAALPPVGAPETVMGKIRVQIAFCDASKRGLPVLS